MKAPTRDGHDVVERGGDDHGGGDACKKVEGKRQTCANATIDGGGAAAAGPHGGLRGGGGGATAGGSQGTPGCPAGRTLVPPQPGLLQLEHGGHHEAGAHRLLMQQEP